MTAATVTKPSLLEVVLDSLDEAYWHRRAEVQGCRGCAKNPAGICADHQADNDAAHEYEEARKRISTAASTDEEFLALLGGQDGAQ